MNRAYGFGAHAKISIPFLTATTKNFIRSNFTNFLLVQDFRPEQSRVAQKLWQTSGTFAKGVTVARDSLD